jgi:hypothetical protein
MTVRPLILAFCVLAPSVACLVCGGCARPETKAACAVIDLASAACKVVVRLEDGRLVEVPKDAVRAVAVRAAASAAATKAPSP